MPLSHSPWEHNLYSCSLQAVSDGTKANVFKQQLAASLGRMFFINIRICFSCSVSFLLELLRWPSLAYHRLYLYLYCLSKKKKKSHCLIWFNRVIWCIKKSINLFRLLGNIINPLISFIGRILTLEMSRWSLLVTRFTLFCS